MHDIQSHYQQKQLDDLVRMSLHLEGEINKFADQLVRVGNDLKLARELSTGSLAHDLVGDSSRALLRTRRVLNELRRGVRG